VQENKDSQKKKGKKKKTVATYVFKPSSGSQGEGISLFQTTNELNAILANTSNQGLKPTKSIVQHYLSAPLLLQNEQKFDLRLYALISSVDPLEVFLCDEGLARFCTEKYEKPKSNNLYNVMAHLTNYSLNKRSDKFNAGGGGSGDGGLDEALQQKDCGEQKRQKEEGGKHDNGGSVSPWATDDLTVSTANSRKFLTNDEGKLEEAFAAPSLSTADNSKRTLTDVLAEIKETYPEEFDEGDFWKKNKEIVAIVAKSMQRKY